MKRDTAVRRLSPPDLLANSLAAQGDLLARPPETPRVVFADVLRDAFGGIGAGVGVGVLLYVLRAPESVVWSWSPVAGALVTGVLLVLDAAKDNFRLWRNGRHIRQAFSQLQREIAAERTEWERIEATLLDALDEADRELGELRRGLDEMKRQRDVLAHDLARERTAASTRRSGGATYVAPLAATPQEVADASEMIRARYLRGEHLSRRAATAKDGPHRWSERRWDAARQQLEGAEVLRILNGAAEYPPTLDKALALWGDYLLRVRGLSAPAINALAGRQLYVENDEE